MIATRMATIEDHPEILSLVTKIAHKNPTYPRTLGDSRGEDVRIWWGSMQTQNPITLVAEEDGVIVGIVNILIPPRDMLMKRLHDSGTDANDRAEIAGMCVNPEIQNRGLGSTLFKAANDYLHDAGRTAVLMVRPTAPSAVHLYEKNGMKQVASFEDHGDTIFVLAE